MQKCDYCQKVQRKSMHNQESYTVTSPGFSDVTSALEDIVMMAANYAHCSRHKRITTAKLPLYDIIEIQI